MVGTFGTQEMYWSRQWGFDRRWRGSRGDSDDGVGGVGIHKQGHFGEERKREQSGGGEGEGKTRRQVGEATAEAEARRHRHPRSLADSALCGGERKQIDSALRRSGWGGDGGGGGASASWFAGRLP